MGLLVICELFAFTQPLYSYLSFAMAYKVFTVLQFLVVADMPNFLSKKLFDSLVLP